jgi:hypothetical protein
MPDLEPIATHATSAAGGAGLFIVCLKAWSKWNPRAMTQAAKIQAQAAKISDLEKRVGTLEGHIAKVESSYALLVKAGRKARIHFMDDKPEAGMALLEMFEDIEASGVRDVVRA